jgi:putative peptidoglycan lipid II flippase
LIFAFYARQNTLTPALVGLLGVGFYLATALLPALARPLQMTDLVLANSLQLTGHALVMLWLVNRLAPLSGRGLGSTALKAIGGSAVMGLNLWWVLALLQAWFPAENFLSRVTIVGISALLGGGLYVLSLLFLKTPELALMLQIGQRFLTRR